MFKFILVIISIIIYVSCYETVSPRFFQQCSKDNQNCIIKQWSSAIQNLVRGVPELSIPPFDPLKLGRITMNVPKLANIQFDGQLKGLKDCVLNDAKTLMRNDRFKKTLRLTCKSLLLKGHYVATANSSVILGSGNGDLKSDGIGKVKADNVKLTFLLDYNIVRDENGEIKFVLKDGPVGHKYKIDGPASFVASNIFLGDQDFSQVVNELLNQNWRFIIDSYGGEYFEKSFDVISKHLKAYFNNISAKSIYKED